MTEEFAIRYTPRRVREKGFSNYRLIFQDLNLKPGQQVELAAYNEIWFLIEADTGIRVSSDYGEYDYNNENLSANEYEHADKITIINGSDEQVRKVKFIQVILQK